MSGARYPVALSGSLHEAGVGKNIGAKLTETRAGNETPIEPTPQRDINFGTIYRKETRWPST